MGNFPFVDAEEFFIPYILLHYINNYGEKYKVTEGAQLELVTFNDVIHMRIKFSFK